MQDLANRIIAAREAKRWTQEDLSRYTQIPQTTISKLERGKIANPSVSVIVALGKAFGVSLDVLLGGTAEDFHAALTDLALTVGDIGEAKQDPRGYVIAVQAAKGGIGKSTTALNLGALIARNYAVADEGAPRKRKVLVLDGDFANGNMYIRVPQRDPYKASKLDPVLMDKLFSPQARHLGADHLLTFARHVLQDGDVKDGLLDLNPRTASFLDLVPEFMRTFASIPQLDVLPAPEKPEDYQSGDANALLTILRAIYDVIIIATGSEFASEHNKVWMQQADRLLILTQSEKVVLESTSKMLSRLVGDQKLDIPRMADPEKLFLVMMRSDADFGLVPEPEMARLGRVIGHQKLHERNHYFFPDYDATVARLNGHGLLPVESDHRYGLSVRELAERVLAW